LFWDVLANFVEGGSTFLTTFISGNLETSVVVNNLFVFLTSLSAVSYVLLGTLGNVLLGTDSSGGSSTGSFPVVTD
jgi:hypothetical protein